MYAAISPSETTAPVSRVAPLRRWADGAAEVSFTQVGGETRLRHLYQSDPCRVLFPRHADDAPKEAVIVTTSGGVVGGDRMRFEIDAAVDCVATVTTQAAEKIYRAAGADSEIDVTVTVRKYRPQHVAWAKYHMFVLVTFVDERAGRKIYMDEVDAV